MQHKEALSLVEAAFRAGLLDGSAPVPEGLLDGAGRAAGRRYAVYRNNVAVSLREALEAGFPAVARLIGPENFAKAAGMFLRAAPPRSPLMMHYGAGFAEFLAGLEPLKGLGYLPDVARLELLLRQSYHAADAPALDPARLQGLPDEALDRARLVLAPSVQLLRSAWPVLSVYRYTMSPGSPKPQARAEDVLITRPGFDPAPHALPAGGGAFVQALLEGQPFGDALAAAGAEFDLGATLGLLLRAGALSDIETHH
ncbi:HvfC/BufC N-terminal domain-containing protein [Tropicibacter oceani]|uniref:DNA-binding domain-containing protein n=1 Tax=Tropicibacter oceani TaxID=3058420 RepID=A0ABY8QM75_9RHOB|nr:DNA-binding domain-containing protein [Tropicibacter oceani]WGW05744.1 DNA-binding domain-containing protein [Tropicibacter oceani]